jgi:hypothetical protein
MRDPADDRITGGFWGQSEMALSLDKGSRTGQAVRPLHLATVALWE